MFSKSVYQFKVDLKQAYKKIHPYPQRIFEAFSKQVGVLLSKQRKALMLLSTSLEVEK